MYMLRAYRVLEEDPWRAELLWERRYTGWDEARERFLEERGRLEEGYTCIDHGSAWTQLCVRQVGSETVEVGGLDMVIPVLEKRLLALEPLS